MYHLIVINYILEFLFSLFILYLKPILKQGIRAIWSSVSCHITILLSNSRKFGTLISHLFHRVPCCTRKTLLFRHHLFHFDCLPLLCFLNLHFSPTTVEKSFQWPIGIASDPFWKLWLCNHRKSLDSHFCYLNSNPSVSVVSIPSSTVDLTSGSCLQEFYSTKLPFKCDLNFYLG